MKALLCICLLLIPSLQNFSKHQLIKAASKKNQPKLVVKVGPSRVLPQKQIVPRVSLPKAAPIPPLISAASSAPVTTVSKGVQKTLASKPIIQTNKISGSQNQVIGESNSIKGDNNKIIGTQNAAKGDNSLIIGSNNKLNGSNNTVNGSNNRVDGFENVVIGNQNLVQGGSDKDRKGVEIKEDPLKGTMDQKIILENFDSELNKINDLFKGEFWNKKG